MIKKACICSAVILVLMLAVVPSVSGAARTCPPPNQNAKYPPSYPQARQWLRRMSDYMDSLSSFQVHLVTSRELIFPKGGRINTERYGDLMVQRPNKLRANVFAPNKSREIYYNGTTLTVFTPKLNVYGTINTPPTLNQMFDMVMLDYGIFIPLADMVQPNIYGKVAPKIDIGIVAGPSLLNGVYCKQLAFRSGTLDWQIWIEDSPTPLPRKIAIVDRGVAGNPQYTALMTDWKVNPAFDESIFTFTPPEGAQKINFRKPGQGTMTPKATGGR